MCTLKTFVSSYGKINNYTFDNNGEKMFDFKNGDEKERAEKFKEISKASGDESFGVKKELKVLPEHLMDNEQVIGLTSGMYDGNTWLVVLTDNRLLFLDKGMLYGLKQVSVPLDQVTSVSGSTGLMMGDIFVNTSGAQGNVKIEMVIKKAVDVFVKMVQDQIGKSKNQGSAQVSAPAQTADDPVAKLEKLAEMLEKGLLTEEEFAVQKAKLLDL